MALFGVLNEIQHFIDVSSKLLFKLLGENVREHETLWAGGKGLRASKLDLYTHGPVGGEKGCVEQEACWTLVIRLMHVGQVLCTVFSGGNFARAGFVSGGGGGAED